MSAATEKADQTGLVLTVVGGVQLFYCLAYSAWSGIALIMSFANTGVQVFSMFDGNSAAAVGAAVGAWGMLMVVIQLVVHLILLAPAIFAIRGGLALKGLTEFATARRGMIAVVVTPIISLLAGLLSLLSFSCCGLFTGMIPTLLVLVLSIVAAVLTKTALDDPELMSSFEVGPIS